MNIILASYLFYPEPIVMSTIVEDIADRLIELEHNVIVLTPKPCRPYGYYLPKVINKASWDFKRIVLSSYIHPQSELFGRFKENISFGKAVKRYVEENKDNIDCIYLNTFPLFCQNVILKEAKKYNIPTILHIEDLYPEPFKKIPLFGNIIYKILLPIDKQNFRLATKVVTLAPKVGKYLEQTRKISNIEIVYNWQDENTFAHCPIKITDKFTFCYLGSLSKATNLPFIIKAFIKSNNDESQLIIAGAGVLKDEIIQIVNESNKENIFVIEAPKEKVAEIQANADVMILPLKAGIALEAFPSKVPAYLYSHKPILASLEKESDVGEMIINSNCGWCADSTDEKALIRLFESIPNTEKSELQQMGSNGYNWGVNNLAKKKNLDLMSLIFDEVLNQK